jgi:tripartite ATP-independent transporter DctP family solute receptor
MRLARSRFVAGATGFCAAVAVRYPGGAAEFSYKLACLNPISFAPVGRAADAAQKILAESGGRLEIKPFPANALGGNVDQLSQLRLGAIELYLVDDGTLATLVNAISMGNLPFIVASVQDGLKILSGDFGNYVRREIAKVGIYQLRGSWYVGFRDFANSVRPVYNPGDVKGLKIRTTGSPVDVAMWKALGATPTPITTSEQYTALQTHVVDGTAASLPGYEAAKLYEVTKYASITHHSWNAENMLANNDAWMKLPQNLRDLAEKHFEAARQTSNDELIKGDPLVLERLKQLGMQVNNVDRPSFQRALKDAGLYAQWRTTYGAQAWSMLEKQVGRIG